MFKIPERKYYQSFTRNLENSEEADEDILEEAMIEIRQKFDSDSKEILIPFHLSLEIPNVKLIVPKVGDKKENRRTLWEKRQEYRIN